MRVKCPHCGSKAIITSSKELSNTVRDMYCSCLNSAKCGASFVVTLAYKNDLNPPMKTTTQIAVEMIRRLDADERHRVQADLFR